MKEYDLAILGAGPGGYVAALRAADLGYKTALIEKDEVGGVCLNVGCIPTKTFSASCEFLDKARRAERLGLVIPSAVANFALIKDRKDKIVKDLVKGVHFLLEKKGVRLLRGEGSFKGRGVLQVQTKDGKEEIKSRFSIIATGSRPLEIPQLPFELKHIIDSTDAVSLGELPKRVLIVGGGYIGCEWASNLSLLGSDVTIVELTGHLLPTEDTVLGNRLASIFKRQGIKIHLNEKVVSVRKEKASACANLASGQAVEADIVMVACGRVRNTQGIGFETLGIKLEKDAIEVDEYLETSAEGVFAIGDVLSSPQLAHVASHEALAAVANLKEKKSKMDYHAVPCCIFTHPPIASVGLGEDKAKALKRKVKVERVPYSAVGMAHVLDCKEGFLQLVADAGSNEVLGAQVFGEGSTEIIGELSLAVQRRVKAQDLAYTIHAHPTMSEIVQEAAFRMAAS